MKPAKPAVKLTYDDFVQFPEDGNRHELIDGEHYVTPSPGRKHQAIAWNLTVMIGSWLKQNPIGRGFAAPFDVVFSQFDVVEPDLLYIAGARQDPHTSGYRVVLGVMSVPPKDVSDGAVWVGGAWPYWEKAGIFVRQGDFTVTVSVPTAWRSRAAITWGNSQRIVSALQFKGCGTTSASALYWSAHAGDWSAYAGGFYMRASGACVPLAFNNGLRTTTVRFGIGTHCP